MTNVVKKTKDLAYRAVTIETQREEKLVTLYMPTVLPVLEPQNATIPAHGTHNVKLPETRHN